MAEIKEVREIALDDLVISKGQVRVRDVGREIDELAESIRKMGLLEPIVVCPAEKPGKFEILTGQRRFLAHKQLQRDTILAAVLDDRVDEATAKALSLTENLVRRDLSARDLIDACTALYKKYGSMVAVAEETGLPLHKVSNYVKYERLSPAMKKLVDGGSVDIRAALRATDAANADGEYNDKDAIKFAKEMSSMSGAQQQQIVKRREEDPEADADSIIEAAKSGGKITQVTVTLGNEVHRSLQLYAKAEGTNQDDAAATLISEGLLGKGFLEE
jgi:ParB family transcriptional regulator, chromosome partitioning protein